MEQKLHYIHQNPVKECIVELAEHYLYSSTRDYAGERRFGGNLNGEVKTFYKSEDLEKNSD